MEIDRKEWMKNARADFKPPEREECAICNDFGIVTQAHHIVPLSMQVDIDNEYMPLHDIVWLCPTCHKIVHKILSVSINIRKKISNGGDVCFYSNEVQEGYFLGSKYPFQNAIADLCIAFVSGDNESVKELMEKFYMSLEKGVLRIYRTDHFDPIKEYKEAFQNNI